MGVSSHIQHTPTRVTFRVSSYSDRLFVESSPSNVINMQFSQQQQQQNNTVECSCCCGLFRSQTKHKLIWRRWEHVAALAQSVHRSSNICLKSSLLQISTQHSGFHQILVINRCQQAKLLPGNVKLNTEKYKFPCRHICWEGETFQGMTGDYKCINVDANWYFWRIFNS